MRIKDGRGKTTERIFLIAASVLTLMLAAYLIWLVQSLVTKSDTVFTISAKNDNIPTFNFDKYNKLIAPLLGPASTTASTTTDLDG